MRKSKEQRKQQLTLQLTKVWDQLMLKLLNEGYSLDQALSLLRLLTKAQWDHKGKAPKELFHQILSSDLIGPPGPKPETPYTTTPSHISPL